MSSSLLPQVKRAYSSTRWNDRDVWGDSMLDATKAWLPDTCVVGECWMQIDLGSEHRVTGVVTQDRGDLDGQYVSTFTVKVCATGQTTIDGNACLGWVDVDGGAVLAGPSASTQAHARVDAIFANFVQARFVRIYPRTWVTFYAMRAGVLVITMPPSPPAPPSPPPMPAAPLLLQQQGMVTLPRSRVGELHTLVVVGDGYITERTRVWAMTLARSYDGHAWEALYAVDHAYSSPSATPPARINVTACGASACTLALPPLTGASYRVDERTAPSNAPSNASRAAMLQRSAAKLLLQGTFGPTRADIARLTARLEASASDEEVFASWVAEEQAKPPSLHREYFRRRANPRVGIDASPRSACEPQSRWHRFAITMSDEGVFSEVRMEANGVRALYIGDRLRTQIPAGSFAFDTANALYVSVGVSWYGHLCAAFERLGALPDNGGVFFVRGAAKPDCTSVATAYRNHGAASGHLRLENPPVDFVTTVDTTTTLVLSASQGTLMPLPNIGRSATYYHPIGTSPKDLFIATAARRYNLN